MKLLLSISLYSLVFVCVLTPVRSGSVPSAFAVVGFRGIYLERPATISIVPAPKDGFIVDILPVNSPKYTPSKSKS